jgi:tryptophan-rich sensory protein
MLAALTRQLTLGAAVVKLVMQKQVQRWVMAIVWLLVSGVIGAVGIIAVLLSLFFELAKMPAWTLPSLITGIVALLLAVLGGLESKRLWR